MCKSAYLHVPFCRDICSYCDFTRCRYHDGLATKWLKVIEKEITEKLAGIQLETIYIGGGTPSALSVNQLEQLLKTLAPYTKECVEYTMEANIDSFDCEKMKLCHRYGINRISLGVQTLQPQLLKSIHRNHDIEAVARCIDQIHEHGIHNISVDMMYGLPGQMLSMWKQDLTNVITQFDVQHISLYALTIEEHSEFGRLQVQNIDEDEEADMYEYAVSFLKEQGYQHYEISNFAKPGYESKHNLTYWRYDDFIGIGMGASGKQNHCRYDNTRNMQTYFERGCEEHVIKLSKEDEMFEMIMMSLRTSFGLDLNLFEKRYGILANQRYEATIRSYQKKGLLYEESGFLKANEKGRELLNEILLSFMDEM